MHDCQTHYPILLLHGLNCRDEQGCWGRIPVLLRRHGARVYLGGQDSYGSIQHNALVLKSRLRKILAEEGCEKVNIIAHSKGGLEARYLISSLGMADQVASLSTVCTPHHGSKTAAFWRRWPWAIAAVAMAVDGYWQLAGDLRPDMKTVIRELTPEYLERFNAENPDSPQVYYQSWGSALGKYSGEGPAACLIRAFTVLDGDSDDLVSPESARWTNYRGTLDRVSHQDVVDSRQRDLDHFSVPEFYVQMVRELVEMGF